MVGPPSPPGGNGSNPLLESLLEGLGASRSPQRQSAGVERQRRVQEALDELSGETRQILGEVWVVSKRAEGVIGVYWWEARARLKAQAIEGAVAELWEVK